jgi:two-component system nitrate/nitrite response regulator NarL
VRTCVIVDDSAAFLAAARELLEREGLRVLGVASNGAEALRQVREHAPDLVLMDIDLGTESGFDLAHELVGALRGSAPPVILVSSHAQSDFADLIEAGPAAGFLPKSQLSRHAIEELLS